MAELYGQAVHQYFAGNYSAAELLLNEVQASGSEDHACTTILACARSRRAAVQPLVSRTSRRARKLKCEARNSFQVGIALTRIQGAARREIEKARLAARAQQQLLEQRARAEAAAAGGTTPPRKSSFEQQHSSTSRRA